MATITPPLLAEPIQDEDWVREIVNGIESEIDMANFFHQVYASELLFGIRLFLEQNPAYKRGYVAVEALVRLSPDTLVKPDVIYVAHEKAKHIKRGIYELGVIPDLVVEFTSSTSYAKDIEKKRLMYQQAGVQEYWLAIPDMFQIIVYALQADGAYHVHSHAIESGVVHSRVLPGFSVSLDEVFIDLNEEEAN